MSGWDSDNPADVGGGESGLAVVLRALKAMVGKGHAADQDGIEWRWREARALGLSLAYGMAEGALAQFHPSTATAGLPFYVEAYDLQGYTMQEARDRASRLIRTLELGGEPGLEALLQEIDEGIELGWVPWEKGVTTMPGRSFGDWAGELHFNRFNGVNETEYPNYSTSFKVYCQFDIVGVPSELDLLHVAEARRILDEELPAWVDFDTGGPEGFIFDGEHNLLGWNRFA